MLTITWFYVQKVGEVGTGINVMGIGIMVTWMIKDDNARYGEGVIEMGR